MKLLNWILYKLYQSTVKYGKDYEISKEKEFINKVRTNHKIWIKK